MKRNLRSTTVQSVRAAPPSQAVGFDENEVYSPIKAAGDDYIIQETAHNSSQNIGVSVKPKSREFANSEVKTS